MIWQLLCLLNDPGHYAVTYRAGEFWIEDIETLAARGITAR